MSYINQSIHHVRYVTCLYEKVNIPTIANCLENINARSGGHGGQKECHLSIMNIII